MTRGGDPVIRKEIERIDLLRAELQETEAEAAVNIGNRVAEVAEKIRRTNCVDVALAALYGGDLSNVYQRVEPVWSNFVRDMPRNQKTPFVMTERITRQERYSDDGMSYKRDVEETALVLGIFHARRTLNVTRGSESEMRVSLATDGPLAMYVTGNSINRPKEQTPSVNQILLGSKGERHTFDRVIEGTPFMFAPGDQARLVKREIKFGSNIGWIFDKDEGNALYVPYRKAARSIGLEPIDPPNQACSESLEAEKERLQKRSEATREAAARQAQLEEEANTLAEQAAAL